MCQISERMLSLSLTIRPMAVLLRAGTKYKFHHSVCISFYIGIRISHTFKARAKWKMHLCIIPRESSRVNVITACRSTVAIYRQKNCTEHIEADGKSKPGGYSETERGKKKGSKVRLLTHHVLEVKSPQITGL